jgi:hypothetical protein
MATHQRDYPDFGDLCHTSIPRRSSDLRASDSAVFLHAYLLCFA